MAGAAWRGSAAAQHVLERQPEPRSDDDGDAVLVRRSIVRLLEMYGTAGGLKSDGTKPKPLYLQGFLPFSLSPMGQHLAKS